MSPMAEADQEEIVSRPPEIAPALRLAAVPWLAPVRARLQSMHGQARLPHALLIFGQPGSGQTEFGLWLAQLLLCSSKATRPCETCVDCKLHVAGNHPDFHWVGVAADKKEISIEQMRSLSATLSFRSYRGGAKAALIAPAEAMNIKSFNALLKTLEEPCDDTFLMLATSRSDRMPRTIASRCMRQRLPLPATGEALEWLAADAPGKDWKSLLALANGAPFLAREYAESGLETLDPEMREAVEQGIQGHLDIVGRAKAWAAKEPAARLFWLESWLTGCLKEAGLGSDLPGGNRLPWLRLAGRESKIQAGYRLLDELREARRLVGSSLVTQLLFEGLLVSLAALLGGGPSKRQESPE